IEIKCPFAAACCHERRGRSHRTSKRFTISMQASFGSRRTVSRETPPGAFSSSKTGCDRENPLEIRASPENDITTPDMRNTSLLQMLILLSLTTIPLGALSAHASMAQNKVPLATFTYNPCVMCAAPGSIVFFNANYSWSPVGQIASYTWNFGDHAPPVK